MNFLKKRNFASKRQMSEDASSFESAESFTTPKSGAMGSQREVKVNVDLKKVKRPNSFKFSTIQKTPSQEFAYMKLNQKNVQKNVKIILKK